jgi:hypothetical protein
LRFVALLAGSAGDRRCPIVKERHLSQISISHTGVGQTSPFWADINRNSGLGSEPTRNEIFRELEGVGEDD